MGSAAYVAQVVAGILELGVLGVVRVGKARAGAGVVGGAVGAGFGAGGGPPAGGVLFELAHFGAAAAGVGFGASAVAGCGCWRAQSAGGIRQDGPG